MRPTHPAVIIFAAATGVLIVGFATVEIVVAVFGATMPIEVRQWILSIAIICLVWTGITWKLRAMTELHAYVRKLETDLATLSGNLTKLSTQLGDLRTELRTCADQMAADRQQLGEEIRTALDHQNLSDVVLDAISPTLTAITDYSAAHATISRISPNGGRQDN